jgi:hypothetical protein
MWRDGPSTEERRREDAFRAWLTWRHAAEAVETAWNGVLEAGRGARAAAYARYDLALRVEGSAAGRLAVVLDEEREPVPSLRAMAA